MNWATIILCLVIIGGIIHLIRKKEKEEKPVIPSPEPQPWKGLIRIDPSNRHGFLWGDRPFWKSEFSMFNIFRQLEWDRVNHNLVKVREAGGRSIRAWYPGEAEESSGWKASPVWGPDVLKFGSPDNIRAMLRVKSVFDRCQELGLAIRLTIIHGEYYDAWPYRNGREKDRSNFKDEDRQYIEGWLHWLMDNKIENVSDVQVNNEPRGTSRNFVRRCYDCAKAVGSPYIISVGDSIGVEGDTYQEHTLQRRWPGMVEQIIHKHWAPRPIELDENTRPDQPWGEDRFDHLCAIWMAAMHLSSYTFHWDGGIFANWDALVAFQGSEFMKPADIFFNESLVNYNGMPPNEGWIRGVPGGAKAYGLKNNQANEFVFFLWGHGGSGRELQVELGEGTYKWRPFDPATGSWFGTQQYQTIGGGVQTLRMPDYARCVAVHVKR